MPSALSIWQQLFQTPALVQYFEGVFSRIGVEVTDTGETLTVRHEGATVSFHPGLQTGVDFVVPLSSEQIDLLAHYTEDGRIDAQESWRIVRAMFTPMTQATLAHPVFAGRTLRRIAGAEDLIHVRLLSPGPEPAAEHTLAYTAGQWIVTPGLLGKPMRTYSLTPEQALDYQRRVYSAMQKDSAIGWTRFAAWYRRWRVNVSA
ncbi:MAG: hypothetical protein AAF752_05130 [Bacteroidota bacterium]